MAVSTALSNWQTVLVNLERGLFHLQNLISKIKAFLENKTDELPFIKDIVEPLTDLIQEEINSMLTEAEKILNISNKEFEASVHQCEMMKQEMNKINNTLEQLKIDLNQKVESEKTANRNYEDKKSQLSRAESALHSAKQKLNDAEIAQVATVATGTTVAAVCAFFAFIFPPALVGVVGGAGASVAGLTVLQEVVDECHSRRSDAQSQVRDSEESLGKAKNETEDTKKQINDLKRNQRQREDDLRRKNYEIERKRELQNRIIELNEQIKRTYQEMSVLNGRVKILHSETHGGYCLFSLLNPLMSVIGSVDTLVHCSAIEFCSERNRLAELRLRVRNITAIEFPKQDVTDLDLI